MRAQLNKLISYARQWIDSLDIKAVTDCLRSDFLTQGPRIEAFERLVSEYCGAKYAVAVNSGTSALHIACLAADLKRGDEGITSPITFVATANAMLYCQAKPVFADIKENTICIDPDQIKKKLSKNTKVLIPVHFGGCPCQMDKIYKIAKSRNIIVIEDACHALGAKFKGFKVGSCKFSDMAVFSFHAVKHITTGEGGMVLTNNSQIYRKLLLLRTHGITKNHEYLNKNRAPWYYEMHHLGFNFRLTDFQSALGISQFKKINKFLQRRQEIVDNYNNAFSGIEQIKLIEQELFAESSHHLYVIRLNLDKLNTSRENLFNEYKKSGILVNVHYIPVYYQPYYRKLGYKKGLCPNAEQYYEETITLPLYPKMSDLDVKKVIRVTKNIVKKFKK